MLSRLGLKLPADLHRALLQDVLRASAGLAGFSACSWCVGMPLDRESALGLFVGLLYALFMSRLTSDRTSGPRGVVVACSGAGVLMIGALLVEFLST